MNDFIQTNPLMALVCTLIAIFSVVGLVCIWPFEPVPRWKRWLIACVGHLDGRIDDIAQLLSLLESSHKEGEDERRRIMRVNIEESVGAAMAARSELDRSAREVIASGSRISFSRNPRQMLWNLRLCVTDQAVMFRGDSKEYVADMLADRVKHEILRSQFFDHNEDFKRPAFGRDPAPGC
jgi:hypothetical protein